MIVIQHCAHIEISLIAHLIDVSLSNQELILVFHMNGDEVRRTMSDSKAEHLRITQVILIS